MSAASKCEWTEISCRQDLRHTAMCACGRDGCHWPWKVEFEFPGDTPSWFLFRTDSDAKRFAANMQRMGTATRLYHSPDPKRPFVAVPDAEVSR